MLVAHNNNMHAFHTHSVVLDAYPNTATMELGSTLDLVCRVVGVPSTTVLSYISVDLWGSCDAGGNGHFACYDDDSQGAQVTWHNSGGPLQGCRNVKGQLIPCETCGPISA